jgi:head-tail adaptor
MQVQSDVDHKLTIRYHPALADLGAEDRAVWNGKVLDIKSAFGKDGRMVEIEVYARLHR